MSADPYCYPGTNVLHNLFNLRTQEELRLVEEQVAAIALLAFRDDPRKGPCGEARLKATHHAIFSDVYAWAGNYRVNVGRMTKARDLGYVVTYGDSAFVAPEMRRIFQELAAEEYLHGLDLERFAERLTYFYSELDSTHPFREGNSRTLRQFSADLARAAGYDLDWEPSGATEESRNALYRARDQAFQLRNYGPLREIVQRSLHPLQP